MAGAELILRRLLEGRAGRWSIIIVTLALILACVLPIADRYFALRMTEADLSAELRRAKLQVERTGDLQRKAQAVSKQLTEMEARALSDENAHAFRQSLVTLARNSGCQLRSLHMSQPQLRTWHTTDDPFDKPGAKRDRKDERTDSGYQLRTQPIQLSVSGTLDQARSLLTELQKSGKLISVTNLSVHPSGEDRNKVVMEVQITLFGLTRNSAVPEAA